MRSLAAGGHPSRVGQFYGKRKRRHRKESKLKGIEIISCLSNKDVTLVRTGGCFFCVLDLDVIGGEQ